MLVYFINHSVAPNNLGGAERSMIKLVEDWYAADPDFEAFFITKAPRGKFIEALEARGWAYRAFPYRGWTIPKQHAPVSEITYFAFHDYESTLRIVEIMEHRRPDLVVTNTLVAPWGAFAAKLLGIPHAWFVREFGDLDHGVAFQTGRAHTLHDIGMLSEAVIANSHAMKTHLTKHMNPADARKISVTYPAVDADRVRRLAAEDIVDDPFSSANDALSITVVGRLANSKGQWRVIDALGALRARGIEARLCLVGSWVEADYDVRLMKRARARGVEDAVTILGERDNPFPYMARADVCITPSTMEAFGRTTLEALILGKPVIVSDRGGGAELVRHGESGFHFDPGDTLQIADALERYARDRAVVDQHGWAARERSVEIQSRDTSNAHAIEHLTEVASRPAYRLPHIARYWFGLPGHYFSVRRAPRITAGFIFTRLGGRLRNTIMTPVSAVARALR